MEYIMIVLCLVIAIACLYFYPQYRQRHTGSHEDNANTQESDNKDDTIETEDTPSPDYTGLKTHELCKALLADLNCKMSEDEEDPDRIDFGFQGETFCIVASNDCLLATAYDFAWGSVELDDIDEVSRLRKAINSINFKIGGPCVVYSIDTEKNRMVVHTKRQFLLTPQIPNIQDYMTAMISGFFDVHRALAHELDRLRLEKEAKK